MNTKHNGFTIVELLVVIVVIAILASITLVAYNGLKDRAYNTSVIQAAGEARKIIDIAYASQGTIHLNNGIPHDGLGLCIGNPSDFPADSHFGEGECHTNAGVKGYWASQELWDILSQYGSGNLSTRTWYDGTYSYMRGIYYVSGVSISTGALSDYLMYSLTGKNQDCVLPGTESVDDINEIEDGNNETSCWINITKAYNGAEVISW